MKSTKQRFYPGDRVRITEDIDDFVIERPEQTFIIGTKGSVGTIVTPEEFWADHVEQLKRAYYLEGMRQPESVIAKHLKNPTSFFESIFSKEYENSIITNVKSNMEANFRYPVKFETVEPYADPEAVICCKVGECQLILVSKESSTGENQILEKIATTDGEMPISTAKCPKCGRDANCSYDGKRGGGIDYCDYYSLRCPHCGHTEKKEQWINLTIDIDGLSQCPYCGKTNRAHRDA